MYGSINSSSMLKVGTILRGVYRIDSYLSSGGFGNTYVATNIEFEEIFAIKEFFMRGVTQRDDNQTTVSVSNFENKNSFLEQKEKFKKEARRIRQLSNDHIIKVHDLFEENGTAYYVMDYVEGENLSEKLKRTNMPLSENEVKGILPQILDALNSVHKAGIWHLDLKPANVMLNKYGIVKIIDFGASKQLNIQKGGATTSTAVSYTNGYAPREQMEQNYDKFGPWTDLYALGATLYALLTNKRPPLPTDIDDDSSKDKHLSLPFSEDTSLELRNSVLWLMQTNRKLRPQSVDEFLERLGVNEETIVASEPKTFINDKKIIQVEKANALINNPSKKSKRNKVPKYFLYILCAILLIFGFFAIKYLIQNKVEYNKPEVVQQELSQSQNVENLDYQTAIGRCSYSGPINETNTPNGIGTAQFEDGRFYKGPFVNGALTGIDAFFMYPNGDVFKGEFRDNSFYVGTYTIAEDGSFFKGTFKNGQPDEGNWYDKNHKIIQ